MNRLFRSAFIFWVGVFALHSSLAQAACCYFSAKDKDITQPGQKVFITWHPNENIESFTVQPKFEGNALDFGMVIPSPSQPKLDEMPRDFFKDLALFTILMPVPVAIWTELRPYAVQELRMSSAPSGVFYKNGHSKSSVVVLESGVVGSLDYKIILASDASGLYAWLKENQYAYAGDQSTLDFYIQKKWFFTVMKIDSKQMKKNPDGSYQGEITPTRFTFETPEAVYPLKITQISVKDATDALFYVQAPQQMDLEGDWSWRPSFRMMWLTFMLGCAVNEEQQRELAERMNWLEKAKTKDPGFETTKLEWARKLGEADMQVLEDPLQNYAQMGGGDLPPGTSFIPLQQFLDEVWADYEKARKDAEFDEHAKMRLKQLETSYPGSKGKIARVENPSGQFLSSRYYWYPNREAPAEEIKGLTRLKGHLQAGQWITKFRKIFRKEEMQRDLVLRPLADAHQQEYVRLMPTSPP